MKKLLYIITILLSLFVTKNVWFVHTGKITMNTNLTEKTEVTAQYRNDTSDKLLTVKSKANKNGELNFDTKGFAISYLKFNLPENTNITKTTYIGQNKQNITLNDENEYIERLQNHDTIRWWHLIVIAGLGWYLAWFLLYAFQNGIPMDDKKLPKILNIEFLRVVFTLGVVWHHFVNKLDIWNKGQFGVELFFILSGFLLFFTFRSDRTVGNFITNKWIRFMPLTVFGGLLISLCVNDANVAMFIRGLFFIPDNAKLIIMHNGSTWFLVVLFWLSLLYFYMLKYFKRESVNIFIAITSILATACVCTDTDLLNGFINVRIMRGIACMGMGYFLVYIYQQLKDKEIVHKIPYNIFEACVFLFAISNIFYRPLFQGQLFAYLSFMAVVLMFVLRKGAISKFFEKPIFAKMARYSLAVYLTHGIVASYIFPIYFDKYKEFFMQNPEYPIAAVLVSAILLGVIAHHMVEIPMTRVLTKWIKDGEQPNIKIDNK